MLTLNQKTRILCQQWLPKADQRRWLKYCYNTNQIQNQKMGSHLDHQKSQFLSNKYVLGDFRALLQLLHIIGLLRTICSATNLANIIVQLNVAYWLFPKQWRQNRKIVGGFVPIITLQSPLLCTIIHKLASAMKYTIIFLTCYI